MCSISQIRSIVIFVQCHWVYFSYSEVTQISCPPAHDTRLWRKVYRRPVSCQLWRRYPARRALLTAAPLSTNQLGFFPLITFIWLRQTIFLAEGPISNQIRPQWTAVTCVFADYCERWIPVLKYIFISVRPLIHLVEGRKYHYLLVLAFIYSVIVEIVIPCLCYQLHHCCHTRFE